jgi:hypothetical protein
MPHRVLAIGLSHQECRLPANEWIVSRHQQLAGVPNDFFEIEQALDPILPAIDVEIAKIARTVSS